MANISPNRFVLQSNDGKTKVEYETTSFVGQPVLNLTQGPGGPIRHFAGSQIRTRNTEIGTLVSVTTQMTVDTGSTSFSVLIPAVTLTSVSDQKTISTEAIVTRHTGPNSVPITGFTKRTSSFRCLAKPASCSRWSNRCLVPPHRSAKSNKRSVEAGAHHGSALRPQGSLGQGF